jgi:amino acid adenylation domain-containing protein
MSDRSNHGLVLPPEQEAIRNKCFHPSGSFVEFSNEEVEQSIPERFEKIVKRYPDQLAVKMGDCALTYNELNKAANRIARAIVDSRGSTPEPIVVLLEQGVPAIAAILGVLKAGKFYVPVNPSFPNARIAAIVADSEAKLLLTNQRNLRVAGESTGTTLQVVDIETIAADVRNENPGVSRSPEDFAYIVYTSGSAGQPKGVVYNHRGLLHKAQLHTNILHICADDRLTLLHSYSTGGAIHNILGALLNGASLFPFDFRAGGLQLGQWLSDEAITIYHSGPAIFRQWVDALTGGETFPALRLIRMSGMPITAADVARYKFHFSSHCLLVHVLGTSEAGTIPHYFMDKESADLEGPIPVGYAVGHAEIFLIDESGRKLLSENAGEIAIKSPYIAQGYWRKPELTKAKFLPDPDGGEERIYLTGDLGRMTSDGCLFHLGRKDFRLKVRGYSIESSEVELALRECTEIKHAVVVTKPDDSGEARLVAYVVPLTQPGPSSSMLREFLNQKLPDYMIPSVFVTLETMPLTPNGKIDRKALPAPPRARPNLEAPFVAPRSSLEQELKEIWSEVLGFDDLGIHDNFFDLGGDSLRAAQVVARFRRSLHLEVSLQDLFSAPTLAALADYVERTRGTTRLSETSSLEIARRGDRLPLSFAQRRLWFLDQLEPGSARYNVVHALQITGQLDAQILQRSLNEIVSRHENLRTVFTVIDAQPFQKILPVVTVELPVIDLTEVVPGANRSSALEQVIAEEAHRPFDLACGPIIRCKLLVLGREQYVLLLTVHHIAFDGWSGTVLEREISAFYAAFSSGKPSPLPELPFQYADYAAWQARSLRGGVAAKLVSYWKKQLANLSRLQLPTDRPRPAVQSCRGARKWFSLSAGTTQALNALSRQEHATLFMLLLTGLQTLLHRYTGQTDIVTGTPVAGRRHAETEKLIGFFLNMLVLRVDLSGDPTFREAVARTRQICLDGYAHEELPFEMLVEELKPERSLDQNPLFQVSFVLQNFPKAPFETADFKEVELNINPGIARFDMHVFMTEEESRLKGYFEYNIDLFEAATIERMIAHFHFLLESIINNPDRPISDLPIVTEAEKHQLLVEWNAARSDYPKNKCVHQLFEEQVERTPDAIAVAYHDRQLTYRELNNRSNHLARYLQKRGVGPEVLVGICVERSVEMIVGLLGILKAGGAYLPLDPGYPKERLAFMLKDTQAPVLLTEESLWEKFVDVRAQDRAIPAVQNPKSKIQNQTVVCLDKDWDAIAQESVDNPFSEVTRENLAYVIYTSGSTGKPKGVLVMHHNVARLFDSTSPWFHFNQDDVWTLFHSYAFDFSVWEIWGALLYGGRLEIVPHWVSRSPEQFYDLLCKRRVTVLNQTPSAFRQVMEAEQRDAQELGLRLIIFGGEALEVQSLKPWFDRHGDQSPRLVNMYGITETTVHATYRPIKVQDLGERLGSPIGWRLPDLEVYILDPNCNPAPIGVAGELYIGGAGLARGYLNQPELTAEKFIPHPFSDQPGTRLYKTGDLARYLPDGNIEFLGRIDNQVKIRGFRIELGEVETVLSQHPVVRQSVVIVREDSPGDRRLVAYVVSSPDQVCTASELRNFLKEKLPEYMVPSAFVVLDAFPLTPNGKLDRKALPAPDQNRPALDETFTAPRTPVEELLTQIWSDVLKVDKVSIHDNFFDLGGHSLLATQLVSRVRDAFQMDIPLRTLFEKPTVEELAIAIMHHSRKQISENELSGILNDLESLSTDELKQRLV